MKNARKRIKIDWRGKKKKIIKSAVLEINTGQKGLKVPDKKIAAIFRNGVDITSGDVSRRLTFFKGSRV